MKKAFFFIILYIIIITGVNGQSHLAVPLDHPVYRLLEIASIKGAIKHLSRAKPYSRSMVLIYLKKMREDKDAFTQTEQKILDRMIREFDSPQKGVSKGNIPFASPLGVLMAGLKCDGTTRLPVQDLDSWHMDNGVMFYLKGDVSSFLSYYGGFGGTFDKVDPDAFVPYSFTKKWDSFHINFGEPRYSLEGIGPTPYFSFRLEDEICGEFLDNHILIRWARLRRNWGFSDENLYLSSTARPYEGIDLYARLSKKIALSYTLGSLGNWQMENSRVSYPEEMSYQKMYTLQMIEFFPTEWLTLSIAASAIWGKRFELGYMNPLMYPVIHQNLQGNFDNVAQSVNCVFQIPGFARFYLSFYADEMEFSDIGTFFSNPRNMVAFQLGSKIPVPLLSFSFITLQYTKIEPFVYTHYPEENYAVYSVPVDMSYTHDGENLGFPLPPNSDELKVRLESYVLPQLKLTLQYRLIRHGTNDKEITGDIAIFGDINEYFHYDEVAAYPDKLFLVDGLYDWNNIISLEAAWEIPAYNAVLSFGYDFAYTWWVENESGKIPPDDRMQHIFSLSYQFFR